MLASEHSWLIWILLSLLGFASGIANALAGGGSLLTLPALLSLGMPAGTANGTIRIALLLQNVAATATFQAHGKSSWPMVKRLAVPFLGASLLGAKAAVMLDDSLLRVVFGLLLLFWGGFLIGKPKSFLTAKHERLIRPAPAMLSIAAIGFYCGFATVGVGFPILALLIHGYGIGPIHSNAVKLALVLLSVALTLPVFVSAGQVAWVEGTAIGVGSMVGGVAGARWQVKKGASVVRYAIVVMVFVSALSILAQELAPLVPQIWGFES